MNKRNEVLKDEAIEILKNIVAYWKAKQDKISNLENKNYEETALCRDKEVLLKQAIPDIEYIEILLNKITETHSQETKNSKSFTAIDFETAQGDRTSICQIGLIRVEDGIIVKELSLLVQPPNNYYWPRFIEIHGITPSKTAKSPTFDQVWHIIKPYIEDQIVVAHNGFSFDFPVLSKTLEYYDLFEPRYEKQCTYRFYKKNLKDLCTLHNISLNHHDALSDARACAELFLKINN